MTTLAKKLTTPQLQAYEGANTLYRCFIPSIMLALLAAHLFQLRVTETELNYFPLTATLISILLYFPALKYYQLCNQIDTTPILQSFPSLQSCSAQHLGESEESTLIVDKPQRWRCQKCDILCDYRTRHCRKCQVCVQRYDHHCFWIGNCVGRHNHRPFFIFLFLQTCNNLLNLYSLYQLHPLFQDNSHSTPTLLYSCYLAMLLMVFGFVLFTGYLFIYHFMLVSSGLTTWEHMRRSKISYLNYLPTGYNPFSKGVVQNIRTFFSEGTRESGDASVVSWGEVLPSLQQSKQIDGGWNWVDNEYYSCC